MTTKPHGSTGPLVPRPDHRESTILEAVTPNPDRSDTASMSPNDSLRASQASAPPWPASIGKFEVRHLLGTGAFGRVYHAHDPELRRDVAIKVPRPEALTPEFRERFIREARAAATIRHANVCPVYEVGADAQGVPFIVMGFVPGRTLSAIIKQRGGPFPPRQAAGVVRRLAQAVEAAHQQGVVHRDLKPGNVLVDSERHDVIVTDFGLAKLVDETDAATTKVGDVLGTPAYMAPEQACGDLDRVGPRSDVYSLGVILYEMLSGRLPFQGSVTQVLGQVLSTEAKPPSVFRPGLDPRLDTICRRAMAKLPEERYASARELATALGDYLRTNDTPMNLGRPTEADVGFDLPASEILPNAASPPTTRPSAAITTARLVPPRPAARSRKSLRRQADRRREVRQRYAIWSALTLLAMTGFTYGLVRSLRPAAVVSKEMPAAVNNTDGVKPSQHADAPPTELRSEIATAGIVQRVEPKAAPAAPTVMKPTTTVPSPTPAVAPRPHTPGMTPPAVDLEGRPIPLGPDGRPVPRGPDGRYPPLGPDGHPLPPRMEGFPPPKFGPDGRPLPPKGKFPGFGPKAGLPPQR